MMEIARIFFAAVFFSGHNPSKTASFYRVFNIFSTLDG